MEFIKVRPEEPGGLEELKVIIDDEIIGFADATLAVAEGVHRIAGTRGKSFSLKYSRSCIMDAGNAMRKTCITI